MAKERALGGAMDFFERRRVGGCALGRARKMDTMRGRRTVKRDQRRKEEVKVGCRRMDKSGKWTLKAGVGERVSQW